MRLPQEVVVNLKNVIAHNTAQRLLQGKTKGRQYARDVEKLFVDIEIDGDQIHEIMMYARMKARQEVRMIKQMQERYGDSFAVSGHGGSEIHIQTLLEMAIAKYDSHS